MFQRIDIFVYVKDGRPSPNLSSKVFAGSTYSPPVEGIGGEALTSPKVWSYTPW